MVLNTQQGNTCEKPAWRKVKLANANRDLTLMLTNNLSNLAVPKLNKNKPY